MLYYADGSPEPEEAARRLMFIERAVETERAYKKIVAATVEVDGGNECQRER